MAIKIDGDTVIDNSKIVKNVAGVFVDTGTAKTPISIQYKIPPESTSNANGAYTGGLYVRAGSSWYYRLGASGFGRTTAWSGTNTLVASNTDATTSANNVQSQLATIKDGDFLEVYITSTRYALFQVNDSSIFSSSNGYFYDVDFVSGTGLHGNTTDETIYLKYNIGNYTTSFKVLANQSSDLRVSPITWVNFNGTGTIAERKSQNVSSLTDNSTGNYTVNFSNSMTNSSYCVNLSATDDGTTSGQSGGYAYGSWLRGSTSAVYGTTSMRINVGYPANASSYDQTHINFALVTD